MKITINESSNTLNEICCFHNGGGDRLQTKWFEHKTHHLKYFTCLVFILLFLTRYHIFSFRNLFGNS